VRSRFHIFSSLTFLFLFHQDSLLQRSKLPRILGRKLEFNKPLTISRFICILRAKIHKVKPLRWASWFHIFAFHFG
jgi:hypothetical protein